MKPQAQKHSLGVIKATVFATIGVAILVSLGVWQLDRKVWKENLIKTLNARLTQTPEKLPTPLKWPQLTQANDEFRRVTFAVDFLPSEQAFVYTSGSTLRPDVQGAGYWVFVPARLAGGSIVVVNCGFVPFDDKDPATRTHNISGTVQIVGVMRWPERRGMFTPADDHKNNIWYIRDPHAMATTKNWGVAVPFYIDQESPLPSGGWPKPGKLQVILPNNHLQYALTWFGLALALAWVYGFWLAGQLRGRD